MRSFDLVAVTPGRNLPVSVVIGTVRGLFLWTLALGASLALKGPLAICACVDCAGLLSGNLTALLDLNTICWGPGGPVTSITSMSLSEVSLITETFALLSRLLGILWEGLAGVEAAKGGVMTMPELRLNNFSPTDCFCC